MDFSIIGDELEHHRKQLEHTLQHADLSFHLSSTPDSASQPDVDHESIEHPRHAPEPVALRDFSSFERQSREYFDDDGNHMHPWSFRTADDEEGVNPYGGETMSTAAHHASNLTLAAGLGGRAHRHEISLSGAEYDPDRPLRDLFPAAASQISAFRDEPSRSRYPGMGSADVAPFVVDNTAEIDRVLQSGHAHTPSRSVRICSPRPPSESSDTESVGNRSRLSEALSRVALSPRRPHTLRGPPSRAQSTDSNYKHSPMREQERSRISSRHLPPSTKSVQQSPARVASSTSRRLNQSFDNDRATPKPRRTGIFPSFHQQDALAGGSNLPQPHQQTPKVARREQDHLGRKASHTARASGYARTPAINVVNPSPVRPSPRKARDTSHVLNTSRGGIYLPDVTGITNAVESPARPPVAYFKYNADDKPREVDVYFITALNEVQAKLFRLEEENMVSRRRVRELEMELELCKREVVRERTRVLEREEMIVQKVASERSAKDSKGKGKEREDLEAVEGRYKEAVEEKKALEALIATLRTHLTRLTGELADHKRLLIELRESREADSRAMHDKAEEIVRLRQEVERLGGEVEVLRGVVEEGLKQRRESGRSRILATDEGSGEEEEHEEEHEEELDAVCEEQHDGQLDELEEVADHSKSGPASREQSVAGQDELESIMGSSRANEKTMRTDHATAGSSHLGASSSTTPFVTSEDLRQISVELEERRSERSRAASASDESRSHRSFVSERRSLGYAGDASPPVSPSPVGGRSQSLLQNDADEEVSDAEPPASPPREQASELLEARQGTPMPSARRRPSAVRPPAPTPAHAIRQAVEPSVEETPFPQIRGEHLERLFFSAPEHNPKTCTNCLRQGRARHQNLYSRDEPPSSPLWSMRPRVRETHKPVDEIDEDEGFAEEDEEYHRRRPTKPSSKEQLGNPDRRHQGGSSRTLPPQTTLTRVIRELEDDFTHYKSIYVELAEQYKDMDPVSNVRRRNVLAQHLHEVVDIIEQKGDQIAKLYSLLTFKDTPFSETHKAGKQAARVG